MTDPDKTKDTVTAIATGMVVLGLALIVFAFLAGLAWRVFDLVAP